MLRSLVGSEMCIRDSSNFYHLLFGADLISETALPTLLEEHVLTICALPRSTCEDRELYNSEVDDEDDDGEVDPIVVVGLIQEDLRQLALNVRRIMAAESTQAQAEIIRRLTIMKFMLAIHLGIINVVEMDEGHHPTPICLPVQLYGDVYINSEELKKAIMRHNPNIKSSLKDAPVDPPQSFWLPSSPSKAAYINEEEEAGEKQQHAPTDVEKEEEGDGEHVAAHEEKEEAGDDAADQEADAADEEDDDAEDEDEGEEDDEENEEDEEGGDADVDGDASKEEGSNNDDDGADDDDWGSDW
eukprot:TRINITY_DN4513_c0_g2_i2.p1 TRINITY_DN4513_c0_g2~~TRINITY_DN4513_c0_g2_i2.p1  ORF type:complete len:317 (+),score=123.88 TRINITY_DN4513_c0_g2_i2:52-951(+)